METKVLFSPTLEKKYVDPVLLGRIHALDMSLIADRMMFKYHWSEKRTIDAIVAYKQFLYLTQVFELPLSPTQEIDSIWHEHILHTSKYATDCQELFGFFLHHYPFPAKLLKDQLCGVATDEEETEDSKTTQAFCGLDGDGEDVGKTKSFCGFKGDGPEKEEKPKKKEKPKQKPKPAPKPKKPKQFVNFKDVQFKFFVLN